MTRSKPQPLCNKYKDFMCSRGGMKNNLSSFLNYDLAERFNRDATVFSLNILSDPWVLKNKKISVVFQYFSRCKYLLKN